MNRLSQALLLSTLVLSACTPDIFIPASLPSSNTSTHVATVSAPASETPSVTTECGYQWAYQDLPELTAQFDQAIEELIPNSNSHATAFGENCTGTNGQVIKFLAMETDFYIRVSVERLDDYSTFGNWIASAMQVVNELPQGTLSGPKPGFIEFKFEKNESESIVFRVPIGQYNETSKGLSGEDLFRMYYTSP